MDYSSCMLNNWCIMLKEGDEVFFIKDNNITVSAIEKTDTDFCFVNNYKFNNYGFCEEFDCFIRPLCYDSLKRLEIILKIDVNEIEKKFFKYEYESGRGIENIVNDYVVDWQDREKLLDIIIKLEEKEYIVYEERPRLRSYIEEEGG